MAPERPITPEKQLLKLIEEHRGKNPSSIETQAIRHRSLSLFSPAAWLGRASFSRAWLKKRFKGAKPYQQFDIRSVNQIALLIIYFLGIYFVTSFYKSLVNFRKPPNLELKSTDGLKSLNYQEPAILKRAVSFYLEQVRQRDIFRMGATKVVDEVTGAESTMNLSSSRIVDATENLRLVGISWSDDPDAMIEDTKAIKTYFVKIGQKIGEVKVQAIFKDKVVLSYSGEEIELR